MHRTGYFHTLARCITGLNAGAVFALEPIVEPSSASRLFKFSRDVGTWAIGRRGCRAIHAASLSAEAVTFISLKAEQFRFHISEDRGLVLFIELSTVHHIARRMIADRERVI